MAIAIGSQGTVVAGTTSVALTLPASIAAGDLLIAAVVTKYPPNNPPEPTGWNLQGNTSGGTGAAGADSGTVDVRWFYRVADGTESGTVTFTNASANAMIGRIFRMTKAAAKNWGIISGVGAQNTATVNWSVATTLTDVTTNDHVFAVAGVNGNTTSYSAEAITATGITSTDAERTDQGSANGDDLHLVMSNHIITAGPASTNVVYAMTAAGSSGNTPAGAVVLIRLREVDLNIDPSGIASLEAFGTPHVAHVVDCSAIASAEAFGTTVIGLPVDASGIATAEAFGTPVAVLVVAPSGVASEEAFGTTTLDQAIYPSSAASEEAFGTPVLGLVLEPGAIASDESFGTAVLVHELGISGIASLEAFGQPVLDQAIYPAGVASDEAFGTAEVVEVQSILPTGIPTEEAFGSPTMQVWIQPVGIASAEVFGTPSLALGTIDVETLYDVGYEKNFTATATFERNWSATVEAAGDASFTAEVD